MNLETWHHPDKMGLGTFHCQRGTGVIVLHHRETITFFGCGHKTLSCTMCNLRLVKQVQTTPCVPSVLQPPPSCRWHFDEKFPMEKV